MALDHHHTPTTRPRRSRRRPMQEQRFSSYLTFGFQASVCMGIFLVLYVLTLLVLSPLLSEESSTGAEAGSSGSDGHAVMRRGQALEPVVGNWMAKVKHHLPGDSKADQVAGELKKRLHAFREKAGMTDASLMEKATAELNQLRQRRSASANAAAAEGGDSSGQQEQQAVVGQAAPGKRAGFVVLGMHRSGTSMLSGLLVMGAGYNVGGPLIGAAGDNEKGFFERIDAVLQNDEFMKHQNVWWAANVVKYKTDVALEHKKTGKVNFDKGNKALAFLNNAENSPWLQKDPRMCITLKTWLPFLTTQPAVVWTYRDPLEVANSLHKREQGISIERGLRLWIVYNMRGIQNSAGLCRVYSSNVAILADPLAEVQRIADELTGKCGVPAAPRQITAEDVERFVDKNLQHNKNKSQNSGKAVIEDYKDSGCKIREYDTALQVGSPDYQRERDLYIKAMRIQCDMESGAAYKDGYQWPEL